MSVCVAGPVSRNDEIEELWIWELSPEGEQCVAEVNYLRLIGGQQDSSEPSMNNPDLDMLRSILLSFLFNQEATTQ